VKGNASLGGSLGQVRVWQVGARRAPREDLCLSRLVEVACCVCLEDSRAKEAVSLPCAKGLAQQGVFQFLVLYKHHTIALDYAPSVGGGRRGQCLPASWLVLY
jgi:hypothetical protein